jgi:hypothetical protein
MIYEVRTYTLRPGTVAEFEERFAKRLPLRPASTGVSPARLPDCGASSEGSSYELHGNWHASEKLLPGNSLNNVLMMAMGICRPLCSPSPVPLLHPLPQSLYSSARSP